MEIPGYRFPKSRLIWRDLVDDVGEIGEVFLRRTRACFYFFLSILLWLFRSLGGACSVVIFLDIIFTRFTVPDLRMGFPSTHAGSRGTRECPTMH
jgi:Fe2+ transport system protein B